MVKRLMVKRLPLSLALLALVAPGTAAATEPESALKDIAFLIGDWEGRSTFHYPREAGKAPQHESVSVACRPVLKESYILCESVWRREDGRARTFLQYFNYDAPKRALQVLYVYDNWPQHTSYHWARDAATGGYVAITPYEGAKGERGEEKIHWTASADRNEIRWSESTRFEGEPAGEWLMNFEFVWNRKHTAAQ